jgi:hypothetical protein
MAEITPRGRLLDDGKTKVAKTLASLVPGEASGFTFYKVHAPHRCWSEGVGRRSCISTAPPCGSETKDTEADQGIGLLSVTTLTTAPFYLSSTPNTHIQARGCLLANGWLAYRG